MILYELIQDVIVAKVNSRPSKTIKSPYLADILLDDGTTALCHSPSLGCSGIISSGRIVMVTASQSKKAASAFTLCHALLDNNTIVGTHPLYAQRIAHSYLLQTYPEYDWKAEQTIGNSRFDFAGTETQTGQPTTGRFIVEVKNVPLASSNNSGDYLDCSESTDKVAIFPDGYRKKKSDPFSTRALKHVQELQNLLQQDQSHTTTRCMLLFVCQRSDCAYMVINKNDPQYLQAVQDAFHSGVEIRCISVCWSRDGKIASLHKEIPILL